MTPQRDVPLGDRTTMRVGGAARHFVEAASEDAVVEALDWAESNGVPALILGGGSNVVVDDQGVDALVVAVRLTGVTTEVSGNDVEVVAAAGEGWNDLVTRTVESGWAGLECLAGIPGLVGATPIQNVGAYGQEVAQTIRRVRVYDRREHTIRELSGADCQFSYRSSVFKTSERDRHVVLAVTYQLVSGGEPTIRYADVERALAGTPHPSLSDVRRVVIDVRRAKSMVLDPPDENSRSCGSFFVNPIVRSDVAEAVRRATGEPDMPAFSEGEGRVKLSAAWLIERAGFSRGYVRDRAGLSTRHTLAIVCRDGATATDVFDLAHEIRDRVDERFGIRLVPEPTCWSTRHGFS